LRDNNTTLSPFKRAKRDLSHYEQGIEEINKAINSARFTIDSLTSKVIRIREGSVRK